MVETLWLNESETWPSEGRLRAELLNDLRKYSFTNRVIPIWNSLSNNVVSADTVNTFKNRLDKFWSNQDVLYDHVCKVSS